jgi:hypothetical protein
VFNTQRRKKPLFLILWSGDKFLHIRVALFSRKRSEMRKTSLQVRITRKALWGESNNVASNKFGQAVVALRTKWCSCFQGLCYLHSDWTSHKKLRSPRNNITPEYGFARQKRYEDMGVQNRGFLKIAANLLLTILRSWESLRSSRNYIYIYPYNMNQQDALFSINLFQ